MPSDSVLHRDRFSRFCGGYRCESIDIFEPSQHDSAHVQGGTSKRHMLSGIPIIETQQLIYYMKSNFLCLPTPSVPVHPTADSQFPPRRHIL